MPSSTGSPASSRPEAEVNFTGFGKFAVADRAARQGINPRTRERITIAASRVPRFSAGAGLKSRVKGWPIATDGGGLSGPGPSSGLPPFADRLAALVDERRSQLCLGLDPGDSDARAARAACESLIERAGSACVAVKPQLACFERHGSAGWAALEAVVDAARSVGLLVVADGKRGDVPHTAAVYAEALLNPAGLGADAATVNPLLGGDALEPFFAAAAKFGAGVFTLVLTSNPGAADFLEAGGDPPALSERIAGLIAGQAGRLAGAGGLSGAGAVVGATNSPVRLARMRELMPAAIFLLPGVGAQGGDPGPSRPRWGRARPRFSCRSRAASPAPPIPPRPQRACGPSSGLPPARMAETGAALGRLIARRARRRQTSPTGLPSREREHHADEKPRRADGSNGLEDIRRRQEALAVLREDRGGRWHWRVVSVIARRGDLSLARLEHARPDEDASREDAATSRARRRTRATRCRPATTSRTSRRARTSSRGSSSSCNGGSGFDPESLQPGQQLNIVPNGCG